MRLFEDIIDKQDLTSRDSEESASQSVRPSDFEFSNETPEEWLERVTAEGYTHIFVVSHRFALNNRTGETVEEFMDILSKCARRYFKKDYDIQPVIACSDTIFRGLGIPVGDDFLEINIYKENSVEFKIAVKFNQKGPVLNKVFAFLEFSASLHMWRYRQLTPDEPKANPQVSLYFYEDGEWKYASMGGFLVPDWSYKFKYGNDRGNKLDTIGREQVILLMLDANICGSGIVMKNDYKEATDSWIKNIKKKYNNPTL